MDRRDLPQIGPLDVEPEALAVGEPLSVLMERLGVESVDTSRPARDAPAPLPVDGWRVLHSERNLVLGAPIDAERRSWRIAQADSSSRRRLSVHPDPQPLRPSRAERAGGLRLRWATVSSVELDPDQLWVDIVNEGDRRWVPTGDVFHVAAVVVGDGRDGAGYIHLNADNAIPLDPGDYARVRAHLDQSSLDGLEPGEHEVHAWLVSLSVRTADPLRVRVSPELLARRAAEIAKRRPSPDRMGSLRARLEILRAYVDAQERVPEILAVLRGAPPDRERSVAEVAALLGCTVVAADAVLSMQLRRLGTHERELQVRELRELEGELTKLEASAAS